jgi:hypothetical protein
LNALKIATTVDVDPDDVEGLLCCAFEGGSNYWYADLEADTYPEGKSRKDFEYYHMELPLVEGGSVKFRDAEEVHEDSADDDGYYRLDLAKVTKGLEVMAVKFPRHWADFINENTDATTGDVFLQCCVFGDVIYG